MLTWIATNGFVWFVRVFILLASCASVQHILNTELGYRMDMKTMLTVAMVTIVTVRLWMPWQISSATKRDE